MPLQDIMNQTSPVGKGTHNKSPEKGSPSGGRQIIGAGRTFKDYEDQLDSLKKDNFNLKLRIYFLEEKMGSTSSDQNAIREDIELKVELESLRKELAEKQELLSQAAKAFELIDEQKKMLSRDQQMYQKSLEAERDKIKQLEKEIEEYKEKLSDCAVYYKEMYGITPESALENEEKLHQMEELVSSLEAEVKQITGSLEEERNWNQELERERDELRERLESEVWNRNKLTSERNAEIERLHDKVKGLEEQILRKDGHVQQYRNELIEKDRLLKEKSALLEEKMKACEELAAQSDKRKKQIDNLRMSLKSKDESFTDLSNKHRLLLSQFENSYLRRNTPPNSPSSTVASFDSSPRMGRRTQLQSPAKIENGTFSFEHCDRSYRSAPSIKSDAKEPQQEFDCKEHDAKKQDSFNKQLLFELTNLGRSYEEKDKEKDKEKEKGRNWKKALESIRELMDRYQSLEKAYIELARKSERSSRANSIGTTGNGSAPSSRRNFRDLSENPERDHDSKQRFDEMERKIDDLRGEIDTIKAEKNRLEEQIQTESEELQEKLLVKEQRIERLECERDHIREELFANISELNRLKDICSRASQSPNLERKTLQQRITEMNIELEEKDQKIEQLSKELQVKTQNLQKLVNTELWSKNKEIAKLHNHMTTSQCQDKCRDSVQLTNLISELSGIGISVKITNDVIQLNYVNGSEEIDAKTMTDYVQKLVIQKKKLENEVDYLKWLKLVSKPDIIGEIDVGPDCNKVQRYCNLLQTHLKDLMKFMKNILKSYDACDEEQHKSILRVLEKSRFISQDFVQTLRDELNGRSRLDAAAGDVRKSRSENMLDVFRSQLSTPSDSEVFSEPDRVVSMARIGLQEQQPCKRESPRSKSKHTKTFSDSEDSTECASHHRLSEYNDDANVQILALTKLMSSLYTRLIALRTNFIEKVLIDNINDDKLAPMIEKVKQAQKHCENLQLILQKKMYECHSLKKASKQHSLRKAQLDKKLTDVENLAHEITKQKSELVEYKENLDKETTEILIDANRENDSLKARIKKLEDDIESSKATTSTLTKQLDQLTLSHSHTLVENTKLTNEKLKLEHELRKIENNYDMIVRSLKDKCGKEINELNHIIDSYRDRMQELEVTNKELRRQVVACEVSDSAPSSSGVSSMMPMESASRPAFDDAVPELQNYNGYYWWPLNISTLSTRSKSSCSPDLGIESDGAATSSRPLKETSKITESMTNLHSDNDQRRLRGDVDNESPLPTEGYEDIEALRQENEALKLRLSKTRKALEDTFTNLTTSNKNKKNVEKAIARHLAMTADIWKKAKTYEQTFEH